MTIWVKDNFTLMNQIKNMTLIRVEDLCKLLHWPHNTHLVPSRVNCIKKATNLKARQCWRTYLCKESEERNKKIAWMLVTSFMCSSMSDPWTNTLNPKLYWQERLIALATSGKSQSSYLSLTISNEGSFWSKNKTPRQIFPRAPKGILNLDGLAHKSVHTCVHKYWNGSWYGGGLPKRKRQKLGQETWWETLESPKEVENYTSCVHLP